MLEGENAYDIVKQFRHVIGRSYIPPKFAFGFGQSRWGYTTKEDFRTVAKGYRENHIPIDMIYMDIDYMQSFKDFTVNEENFPDFPEFVQEMDDQDIRLIPIIDAGVKVEPGYEIYEEGVKTTISAREKTEVILLQLYGREIPISGYAESGSQKMVRGQISFSD